MRRRSNSNNVTLGDWWAIASTALTGDEITVTTSTDTHDVFSLNVWGVVGANTASPFDPNAALPAITREGSFNNGTPNVFYLNPVTVSTSIANDMVLCLVGSDGASGWGIESGFTVLDAPGGHSGAGEYKVVSSTQTDLNVVIEPGLRADYVLVGDAVQAAPTSTTVSSKVTATSDTTSSASSTSTSQTAVGSITSTVSGSASITNTLLTTTTTTGLVAGTSTTTFTSPVSTSYSTDASTSVVSSSTSLTQTGTTTTGTSLSETTTSSSTSFGTTTSTGTVTVTETNTYYVLLTQLFQELEQFEALILQTLGFTVTATPVGQQVKQVIVTFVGVSKSGQFLVTSHNNIGGPTTKIYELKVGGVIDGKPATLYTLNFKYYTPGPPNFPSGTTVTVTGYIQGTTIYVISIKK
jgi:hypothetical protein